MDSFSTTASTYGVLNGAGSSSVLVSSSKHAAIIAVAKRFSGIPSKYGAFAKWARGWGAYITLDSKAKLYNAKQKLLDNASRYKFMTALTKGRQIKCKTSVASRSKWIKNKDKKLTPTFRASSCSLS